MTYLLILAIIASLLLSLFFSSLTYAMREFARGRLEEALARRGKSRWYEPTVEQSNDLIVTTAVGRLVSNLLVLIAVLHLFHHTQISPAVQYFLAVLITAVLSMFFSVAIPHALSRHAGEGVIAAFVEFIHTWRKLLLPATSVINSIDSLIAKAARPQNPEDAADHKHDEMRQEIVSAVEEGQAGGFVDEAEKEMIRSVIEFKETTAGEIMTPRPEMTAIEATARLDAILQVIETSGLSRVPVYEGSLDHIVGLVYARDLLKFVGVNAAQFDVRPAMRHPFFVPASKTLRDLLNDFRHQKIHMAIVLDEYGGTAGLVTIEDVLEELVGEISDEHEPAEPAMLKRLGSDAAEADARIRIEELNQLLGLNLPDDVGYDTLGGYLSHAMGRIPAAGAVYNHPAARFTVLDAEPQRVNRVKIEVATPTPDHGTA